MLILETGCNYKNKSKGFTLIEMLVVLFIIGISATLVLVNFSSVNSIEKRANSIEDSIKFLAEESIITGNIIAWYFDSKKNYATYVYENGEEKQINNIGNSVWKNSSSLKTTFKYLDGTKIELQQDRSESPLLIFYPSGEISGGEIDLYHEDYIQRLVIKNNGKIYNEIIRN
jgi:type II secretion system protein H